MSTNPVDENPVVRVFRNAQTAAHLESLMHLNPEAISWDFEVSWCVMDTWIEELPRNSGNSPWSTQWPVSDHASVLDRLTPPIDLVQSLSAHLTTMQIAHGEAVGGPLDGIRYYVEAHRNHTILSLLY